MSFERSNKGMLNVEYFLALVVFLIFTTYLALQLMNIYPQYLDAIKEEILRSDAYSLSEVLVNDDGQPTNWTAEMALHGIAVVKRMGLSNESHADSNLLGKEKIVQLNNTCNPSGKMSAGYSTIKSLLGAGHKFSIVVNASYPGSSTPIYMRCESAEAAAANVALVRRIVATDNGNYGELIVEMWW